MLQVAAVFLACGLASAVLWAPVAAERAVEATRFEDRLGTVPVQVSLSHNDRSTLDTGALGSLYWEQTGAFGFGARVRVTGTPAAGGSLASYASPTFVRANAAVVGAPEVVARAYGNELRSRFLSSFVAREVLAFLVGGLILTTLFRGRSPLPEEWSRPRSVLVGGATVVALGALSVTSASWLFDRWEGNAEITDTYPMPEIPQLSFSSPQTLEIARQIQPFLKKNNDRIRDRSRAYAAAAEETLGAELASRAGDLAPREGEVIVLAEADPQGSQVGTRVRTDLYGQLVDTLGDEAFALRTVSGDVTSNGTVAEASFVAAEATASGDIPTVVVKGDHDTDTTLEQLDEHGAINPHFDLTDVDGLDVIAGNDPAFKTLFGGTVVNESGISETELGQDLRAHLDEEYDGADEEQPGAVLVLLHQPRSVQGFLDLTEDLGSLGDRLTTPYDDGIPDVPPGIINLGHLHDASAPRIIWNTDTDRTTWTVVNQLGTSGGVEESPTYNRFSTPFSVPLKNVTVQLQYVDADTGLQTAATTIAIATDGTATISDRIDIGLQ